jgi:hypothetical protein
MMPVYARTQTRGHIRRLLFGVLLASLIAIFARAPSRAAVTTIGSPLSVPATLNTADNLDYQGTNTDVPPSPEAPNGVVHTYHYGAAGALWNVAQTVGDPLVRATGQALKVNLEGCAQVTLGTGHDATHICAGGTGGLPPAPAPIRVSPQTDGVNHERVVTVAVFCRVSPCEGVATLSTSGGHTRYGLSNFNLQAERTMHAPIRVTSQLITLIRRHHGAAATLSAVVGGETVTQTVRLKIF